MTSTTPGSSKLDEPTAQQYLRDLRQMIGIRLFEEKAAEAYALGKIGGFCHLYIGQEAVAVGSIGQLRDDDYVISSYREHGQALTRGVSMRGVMAELYGKDTGCSRGKGGSMHLFDASRKFLGGHGIVGSHIPIATGLGFSVKYRGGDQVVLCYFGEAAVNIGAFHEALNMAALWKLPVIFLCENNRYGMGTALERASAIVDIVERACAYDMAAEIVDGMDILNVQAAVQRAVNRARTWSHPTFLEVRTYRFMGHSMSDPLHGVYRTKEEVEEHKLRDPISSFAEYLTDKGVLDNDELEAMRAAVAAEVDDARTFADQSPDPAPEELYTHVYAED